MAMVLHPFVPIEAMCPDWYMARETLEAYLPKYLTFTYDEFNHITSDRDWIDHVARAAPEHRRTQISSWGAAAVSLIIDAGLQERMSTLLGRAATHETLLFAEDIRARFDIEQEVSGRPTTIRIIRHIFGLEAATTPTGGSFIG